MKKFVFPAISIILIVLLGIPILLINLKHPTTWQDEFDRYLNFKNSTSSDVFSVPTIAKAKRPWNFTPEMSQISIGESAYYQTDFRYEDKPSAYDNFSILPAEIPDGSLIPLPYPPKELWCAFLETKKSSENNNSSEEAILVIVALHQDLYNADFVIHEIAPKSQNEINYQILAAVECEFP